MAHHRNAGLFYHYPSLKYPLAAIVRAATKKRRAACRQQTESPGPGPGGAVCGKHIDRKCPEGVKEWVNGRKPIEPPQVPGMMEFLFFPFFVLTGGARCYRYAPAFGRKAKG